MSYSPYQQTGGAASAWRHNALNYSVSPEVISQLTLKDIDNSPMFNPLQTGTVIPMGHVSTGILPQGIYYMNQAAAKNCKHIEGCIVPEFQMRQVKSGKDNLVDELKKAM